MYVSVCVLTMLSFQALLSTRFFHSFFDLVVIRFYKDTKKIDN